jgi:superfamily II DNA or RNA helicase
MSQDLTDRYNRFQANAVDDIESDFAEKPTGRFLLVIPTGGGKTFTAVKAVNRLFSNGLLDASQDRVLWTAHRNYLLEQAKETFEKYSENKPPETSIVSKIDFEMVGKTKAYLSRNRNVKLVVIDEAHHGAANSYQAIFEKTSVGVLGLTATPTRHDGKPLDFERESFSIGFPDLIELGVVLRPKVVQVDGGDFDFSTFDQDDLEQLNTAARNAKIINAILEGKDDFQKVVIYVGTKTHAKSLWQQLRESALADYFDSISYILGNENSRKEDRDTFLDKERNFHRAILINVDVLTEGYDDPAVNTIVMARPTNSKLVYMQAMGRAVRRDPANDSKAAYVLEVVDSLPNIRYRIDNRWLYAEISDALEPAVEDREYCSATAFQSLLNTVYEDYNVPQELRLLPEFDERQRYALLLFKVFLGPTSYCHIPIVSDRNNRLQVSNFFNYMSARIPYFVQKKINTSAVYSMAPIDGIEILSTAKNQRRIFEAMENSISDQPTPTSMRPWITYFSLSYRPPVEAFSDEVKAFLEDMVNGSAIREQLTTAGFPPNSYLVRFPLPVGSFLGRIVTFEEYTRIQELVNQFENIKATRISEDHRPYVTSIVDQPSLPVEQSLMPSLTTIVRYQIQYATKI